MADGHLLVTFPGGTGAELKRHVSSGGRLFPFDVHITADAEIFIRSALNGGATALQGRRINAIDGVAGRQITERLLAHINGDTPALRVALIATAPTTCSRSSKDGRREGQKVGGAALATQSGGTQEMKLSHTPCGLVVPRFLLKRPSGGEGLVQPDILIPDDPFRAATAIEALLRL